MEKVKNYPTQTRRGGVNPVQQILKAIRKYQTFFITTHIHPDGDSIGSELAMALFLKQLGKKFYIGNKDDLPQNYSFLPLSSSIKKIDSVKNKFEVALILDCSDLERTGKIINLTRLAKVVIVIDHHLSAVGFGQLNYIDKKISSCAEQIYNLIKESKKPLTLKEATCLYTGIVTETGKFQEDNTNPRVHQIVSELIQKGVNPAQINKKVYQEKSFSQMDLLGKTLSTLKTGARGQIAYVEITQKMFRECEAKDEDIEGFIDYPRSIKGVKIALLFKETLAPRSIKVSFRSNDKIDVNRIAEYFGGGGHYKAAGCFIKGSLPEVKKKILNYVLKFF